MKEFLWAGLVAAAFLGTPATAQMGGSGGNMNRAQTEEFARTTIGRFDVNSDGTISQDELDTAVALMAEMGAPAAAGDRLRAMFANLAVDGTVKIDDVIQMQLTAFDAADANGDGILTRRERRAAAQAAK
jgi:Ca2+-binding EF-hand superfamily protein